MAEIVSIKVGLSTKQWPGNMNSKNGGMNYSGGADLELGVAFDEAELPIDVDAWQDGIKSCMEKYVSPMFHMAGQEVLEAREIMVLPPVPVAPEPKPSARLGQK